MILKLQFTDPERVGIKRRYMGENMDLSSEGNYSVFCRWPGGRKG